WTVMIIFSPITKKNRKKNQTMDIQERKESLFTLDELCDSQDKSDITRISIPRAIRWYIGDDVLHCHDFFFPITKQKKNQPWIFKESLFTLDELCDSQDKSDISRESAFQGLSD